MVKRPAIGSNLSLPRAPAYNNQKHTHTEILAIVEEAVGDLHCEAANETAIMPLIILVLLGLFVLPPLMSSIAVISCWRTHNDDGRDLETGEVLVACDSPDVALGPVASKGSLLDSDSEDALHAAARALVRADRSATGRPCLPGEPSKIWLFIGGRRAQTDCRR